MFRKNALMLVTGHFYLECLELQAATFKHGLKLHFIGTIGFTFIYLFHFYLMINLLSHSCFV